MLVEFLEMLVAAALEFVRNRWVRVVIVIVVVALLTLGIWAASSEP